MLQNQAQPGDAYDLIPGNLREDVGAGVASPAGQDVDPYDLIVGDLRNAEEPLGFSDLWREVFDGGGWKSRLPFFGAGFDVAEMHELWSASKALEDGEASQEQMELVMAFTAHAQREKSIGYTFGSILAAMPGFMIEFITTGGIANAAKGIGTKALGKGLRGAIEKAAKGRAKRKLMEMTARELAKAAPGAIARGAGQAGLQVAAGTLIGEALGGSRISATAWRRALPDMHLTEDEAGNVDLIFTSTAGDFADEILAATGDEFIEMFSENAGAGLSAVANKLTGGALGDIAGKVAGATKLSAMQARVANWWLTKHPGQSARLLKIVAKQAGWHGPIQEYLEERLGGALRGATGIEEGGIIKNAWPDLDQQAAELLAFSAVGGGFAGFEAATSRAPADPHKPAGFKVKTTQGEPASDEEIDQLVAGLAQDTKTPLRRSKPKRAEQDLADEFGRARGVNVIFVESEDGKPIKAFDGAQLREGVLAIDANAKADPRRILLEEMFHNLEDLDKELHDGLADMVLSMDEERFKGFLREYKARYMEQTGEGLSPDMETTEGLGNYAQAHAALVYLATTEGGRNTLADILQNNRSFVDTIRDWLGRGLGKMGLKVKSTQERRLAHLDEVLRSDYHTTTEAASAALALGEALEAMLGTKAPSERTIPTTRQLGPGEESEENPENEATPDDAEPIEDEDEDEDEDAEGAPEEDDGLPEIEDGEAFIQRLLNPTPEEVAASKKKHQAKRKKEQIGLNKHDRRLAKLRRERADWAGRVYKQNKTRIEKGDHGDDGAPWVDGGNQGHRIDNINERRRAKRVAEYDEQIKKAEKAREKYIDGTEILESERTIDRLKERKARDDEAEARTREMAVDKAADERAERNKPKEKLKTITPYSGLGNGERYQSASGRALSPAPIRSEFDTISGYEDALNAWLLAEAIEEAKIRGDGDGLAWLESLKPSDLPESDDQGVDIQDRVARFLEEDGDAPKAKKEKNLSAPLEEITQYSDQSSLAHGDTFRSASGRVMSPTPIQTPSTLGSKEYREAVHTWLRSEAIAEAKHRKNKARQAEFEETKAGMLSSIELDEADAYLMALDEDEELPTDSGPGPPFEPIIYAQGSKQEIADELADGDGEVVIIGCCNEKLEGAAKAKDLYQSQLFMKARALAEATGLPWMILSAKHGLVEPNAELEPYDLDLSSLTAAQRRAWAGMVAKQLDARWGGQAHFRVYAGKNYVAGMKGTSFEDGLARMSVGIRLRELNRLIAKQEESNASEDGPSKTPTDTDGHQQTPSDADVPTTMQRTKPDMFGQTEELETKRIEGKDAPTSTGSLFQEDTGVRGQSSILDPGYRETDEQRVEKANKKARKEARDKKKPGKAEQKAKQRLKGRQAHRKKREQLAEGGPDVPFRIYIRANGGIRNWAGELTPFTIKEFPGIHAGAWGLPPLILNENSQKGMTWEDAMMLAHDRGYFAGDPKQSSLDDLTDLLGRNEGAFDAAAVHPEVAFDEEEAARQNDEMARDAGFKDAADAMRHYALEEEEEDNAEDDDTPFSIARDVVSEEQRQLSAWEAAGNFAESISNKGDDPLEEQSQEEIEADPTKAAQRVVKVLRGDEPKLLGNALAADLDSTGSASLIYHTVNNHHDLARLSQVFRNPAFETFRYFFTRDGVIVSQTGVTVRLPGVTPIYIGSSKDTRGRMDNLVRIVSDAQRAGADSYWILHNHPSGDPTPSAEDRAASEGLSGMLPLKQLGHVVIDHNSYGLIPAGGKTNPKILYAIENESLTENPALPHSLLGLHLSGAVEVHKLAGQLRDNRDEFFHLVGLSSRGVVRGLYEVPRKALERTRLRLVAEVRSFARRTGSGLVIAANFHSDDERVFSAAITNGVIWDAITRDGSSLLGLLRSIYIERDLEHNSFGRRHLAGIEVLPRKKPLFSIPSNRPWKMSSRGKGDIYIQRIGPNAGKPHLTRQGPSDIALTTDPKVLLPQYLYYVIQFLAPKIQARSRGSVQQGIRQRDIDDVLVEHFRSQDERGTDTTRSIPKANQLGFYSQSEKAIRELTGKRFKSTSVINLLKKGQVKDDEIAWMLLKDWLAESKGVVTKDELLEFIRENSLVVSERLYGDTPEMSAAKDDLEESKLRLGSLYARLRVLLAGLGAGREPDAVVSASRFEVRAQNNLIRAGLAEVRRLRDAVQDLHRKEGLRPPVKYPDDQYNLPGGKHYRELVLTMAPQRKFAVLEQAYNEAHKRVYAMIGSYEPPEGYGHGEWAEMIEEARGDVVRAADAIRAAGGMPDEFREGHYGGEIANVLVQIRLSERTNQEGGRVLFIEEVQSDWHAEGATRGYHQPGWEVFNTRSGNPVEVFDTEDEARSFVNTHAGFDYEDRSGTSRVPNAPFKATWESLAMKRMVRWAAEHGFDQLAWTTGAQQVDRYPNDLSMRLKSIEWRTEGSVKYVEAVPLNGDPPILFELDKRGVVTSSDVKRAENAGFYKFAGKEMANEILSSPGGSIAHDELTLGGRGMEAAYNERLPGIAEKLAREFNAEVGRIFIDADNDPMSSKRESVHAITISPAMRESVSKKGFPLFSIPRKKKDVIPFRFDAGEEAGMDRFRRAVQDKDIRILRLEQALESAGAEIHEDDSVYGRIQEFPKLVAAQIRKWEQGHLKSLIRLLGDHGISLDDADLFIYARHAVERNAYIAEKNLSNWAQEQIVKIVAKAKSRAVAIQATNDKREARLEDETDPKKRAKIHKAIAKSKAEMAEHLRKAKEPEEYLPPPPSDLAFQDTEKNPGSGMADSVAKKHLKFYLEGDLGKVYAEIGERIDEMNNETRDKLVEHQLISGESAAIWREQYEHYIPLRTAVEPGREVVGQRFDTRATITREAWGRRSYAHSPLAFSILQARRAIIFGNKNEVGLALHRIVEKNAEMLEDDFEMRQEEAPPEPEDGEMIPTETIPSKKEFGFKLEGKDTYMRIEDALTLRALTGTGEASPGPAVRVFAAINRWLAMMSTSLDPGFMLSNFIRDLQTAGINMTGEKGGAMALEVMRMTLSGAPVKAAWRGLRGVQQENEWDQAFRDLEDAGGVTGWYYAQDFDAEAVGIERELEDFNPSKPRKLLLALRRVGVVIEDANKAVENGVRLAAFKVAMENGASRRGAAALASNLTVNFNRRGEWGQVMNAFYLFYNASVQGSARLLRSIRYPGVQKVALGIALSSAILDAVNRSIGDDDEDGTSFYEKIPEWIRARNLIVMLPNTGGKYIKIPLPYGYNIFHAIGTETHAVMAGYSSKGAAASRMAAVAWESFYPLGSEASVAQTVLPTLADPIVQLASNETFYGSPIRPTPYGSPAPPRSQMYWSSVNPNLKDFSAWLNRISGGDEIDPGFADVSPEDIEHVIAFIGGGAGRQAKRVWDLGARLASGETSPVRDVPILRRIHGEPDERYDRERFVEERAKIKTAEGQIKEYGHIPETREELVKEKGGLLRMAPTLKKVESQLRKLRKMKRAAEDAGMDKRVKLIDAKMKSIRGLFHKLYAANV